MNHRVILYHKQASSARTRFLEFPSHSVCAFEPLPDLSRLQDETPEGPALHPASVLKEVEERLGLETGTLEAGGDYKHCVEVPGDTVQIVLANITTTDPPFDLAEKAGARFIDLTQARGLPAVELQLLRHAYELVMGG